MNQGAKWVILMEKNRSQKSQASVPFSTWHKLFNDSNQLATAADNSSLATFIFHNN
jgi:hypothetical protein